MGAYAPSRHFCPEMWLPIFFFDLFHKVSTEARCWGSPPPNGNGWRLCEGWEYIDSFNSNLRLLINPMEWFPPPFSVSRWDAWVVEGPWQATRKGKRPSRTFDPDNKARRCVEGSWRDDRRSSSGHWRGEKSCLATPSGSGIFARSPEGDITRDGCDPESGEHLRGRVGSVISSE